MANSVLDRLKSETQTLHKQVEKHIAITEPSFEISDYQAYLFFLEAFYFQNEPKLLVFEKAHSELCIHSRKKHTHLVNDIKSFSPSGGNYFRNTNLDVPVDNLNDVIGFMYVSEGSTLGGQIILKILRKRFEAPFPSQFLDVYGPDTSVMWRSFRRFVQNNEFDLDPDQVLRTARLTFETFLRFRRTPMFNS